MTEVEPNDSNQGDLVEYTAAQLGVSLERAHNITSINHPNILDVEIVPVPVTEQEGE
ncbi:MAG TPA: hypothetical protein VHD84_00445 [Candidatus Saccharimonadales bacterium]|nr:hypothetical protein [Candidatus Saccharimonadales bacterium]